VAIDKARLQKEAAEMRALHQLNVLKAEFVSTVSHELRSPLTPILGFAELLLIGPSEPDGVREMAGEIYREAQHMQKLVDDLLDVSRMEAGRFRIDIGDVDLGALLEREVRQFDRQSARHRVVLSCPTTLPNVEGDAVRLRQVIDNLLSNAIKYSPDGGRVNVVAMADDHEVTVSVSDQGIGLEPEKLDRLFEKFYRLENKLAHRVRGSGLGLAIAKHIVETHAGRIWATSELGRGSTFAFSVPIRHEKVSEPDAASGEPKADQPATPGIEGARKLGDAQADLISR
jgi:signal transduction histidine kinase